MERIIIRHVKEPEHTTPSMLRVMLDIGFVKLFKYGYGLTRKGYNYFKKQE